MTGSITPRKGRPTRKRQDAQARRARDPESGPLALELRQEETYSRNEQARQRQWIGQRPPERINPELMAEMNIQPRTRTERRLARKMGLSDQSQ